MWMRGWGLGLEDLPGGLFPGWMVPSSSTPRSDLAAVTPASYLGVSPWEGGSQLQELPDGLGGGGPPSLQLVGSTHCKKTTKHKKKKEENKKISTKGFPRVFQTPRSPRVGSASGPAA